MNERFVRRTRDGFEDLVSAQNWAREFLYSELRGARDVQVCVEQMPNSHTMWAATVIGTVSGEGGG